MKSGLASIDVIVTDQQRLHDALRSAFGSSNDQKHMNIELLCSGEYGLPRFYDTIVAPVLDREDRSSENYDGHIEVLRACCNALAMKMRNFSKVSPMACSI
jgi:hypothetical protein